MFSHNESYAVWHWQYLLEHHAGARVQKFLTYSLGGAILFDFVVIHNGSILLTGNISDAIGWWPTMCDIKAGDKVYCVQLPCLSSR